MKDGVSGESEMERIPRRRIEPKDEKAGFKTRRGGSWAHRRGERAVKGGQWLRVNRQKRERRAYSVFKSRIETDNRREEMGIGVASWKKSGRGGAGRWR